jgi:Tfp pilus assembly protein PilF
MERLDKLKEFLKASPGDSFIKHAMALEYQKSGDILTARKTFEDILAADPGYVGSYYQLGKLLESTGENDTAVEWYQKGMTAAKAAGDQHAYNELRAAYEDLAF